MYPPLPIPAVGEPDALLRGVPETVLQDVWRHRRFDARALVATTGDRVDIIHAGRLNGDAGPDFVDARVALTDPDGATVLLAGDVEVHRTSGEWALHRHDTDPRYDRVVLHVAFAADRHTGRLRRSDGTPLPEVVLGDLLDTSLRRLLFEFFAHPRPDFPCAATWDTVPEDLRRAWARRLGRRHFLSRVRHLASLGEPDELLHRLSFRALGYLPNADAMQELARRVPRALLASLPDPLDRETVLFGVSGLLPSGSGLRQTDPRAAEFADALASRFRARPESRVIDALPRTRWALSRLRPVNQPAIRIAQAAALYGPGGIGAAGVVERLAVVIRAAEPIRYLRMQLMSVSPTPFWQDHVRFETRVPPQSGRIGVDRADRILVDAILPALALHAQAVRDRALARRVLDVVSALPAASDALTRRYRAFRPRGEIEAQGLRALATEWCPRGRCLACAVGRHLVRDGSG